MRTVKEISRIVGLSNKIRGTSGRFWFTCENQQFRIKKEYTESEFDAVRERFLDSSKFPVQVFAHWEWRSGEELITCSKRLDPHWLNFETETEKANACGTLKTGLLQELAQKILLQQAGAIENDELADELLESIYKDRGRPEIESKDFA